MDLTTIYGSSQIDMMIAFQAMRNGMVILEKK